MKSQESKISLAEFTYELVVALRDYFEGEVANIQDVINISLLNGRSFIIKITEA